MTKTQGQQHGTRQRLIDGAWPLTRPAFHTYQEDWYWISARFHSVLSAFLKERHNIACFSKSDSCVTFNWLQDHSRSRAGKCYQVSMSILGMFKKSNFALVAPDESHISLNSSFSLEQQTSGISLYYYTQHPGGSATSNLINHRVAIYKWWNNAWKY